MIGEGYFDKGEEEHFQDRMNNVDKRMQNLLEHSQRNQEKWVKSLHRILVYYTSSFFFGIIRLNYFIPQWLDNYN